MDLKRSESLLEKQALAAAEATLETMDVADYVAGEAAKEEFWASILDSEKGVADTLGKFKILPEADGRELSFLLYNPNIKGKRASAGILFNRIVGEGDMRPVKAKLLAPTIGGRLNKELIESPYVLDKAGIFLSGFDKWTSFETADEAELVYEWVLYYIFDEDGGVPFYDSINEFKTRAAEVLRKIETDETPHPELYTPEARAARKTFWDRCGVEIESGRFPATLAEVNPVWQMARKLTELSQKVVKLFVPSGNFPALLTDVVPMALETLAPKTPTPVFASTVEGVWEQDLFSGEFQFVPYTQTTNRRRKKH